jgi:hypothetical protein
MAARRTLVQVAAEAGCSIGLVQKYELNPDALSDQEQRRRLDAIYSRFPAVEAA